MSEYDAIVVGAGPNGLTAGAVLSRAGKRVLVIEQADTIGGGTRTEELTLPGFRHDICSAIHPMAAASPAFAELGLSVDWVHPEIPLAHPLGDGRAVALHRDIQITARSLGSDGVRYLRVLQPLVERADEVVEDFLGPLQMIPNNPGSFVRLATRGALPAATLISGFSTTAARALMSGLAAHAIAPYGSPLTGGVMLLFAVVGHAFGWPISRGGSSQITDRLAAIVTDDGGVIETGRLVKSLGDLPEAPAVLLDVMPEHANRIAGDRIGSLREGRRGPAVFKVDWALDGPIPWLDEHSPRAGTVHVGGAYEEVRAAEDQVHEGGHPERPFVILAQQSLFDESRAPEGNHTAWGYCHVPSGSTVDMTAAIEAQVERFAPGFKNRVIGRHTMNSAALEAHNPNNIDGDIAGGGFGPKKVFQLGSTRPYRMADGLFLCSSATPPGAGVHGMCGYYAARAALAG